MVKNIPIYRLCDIIASWLQISSGSYTWFGWWLVLVVLLLVWFMVNFSKSHDQHQFTFYFYLPVPLQRYTLSSSIKNWNQMIFQVSKMSSSKQNLSGSSVQPNDTIYLCNFRVSVDGEWLCLKVSLFLSRRLLSCILLTTHYLILPYFVRVKVSLIIWN